MIYITETKANKNVGSSSLMISFDFNQKIIDTIKQTNNAVWNKKEKYWEVPCNKLAFLIDNLSYIDDIELNVLEDENKEHISLTQQYKTTPFKYQYEGIEWMLNNPNCLLLDPPGLGKTLQIIYVAEELKAQKNIEHCLILCGINSLKTNWKKEIQKHSKYDAIIIGEKINSKGKVSYSSIRDRAEQLYNKIDEFFIILNVESLRDNMVIDAIKNSTNKFEMIAFDEVHRAKSPTSEQGKNLLKLKNVGNYHIGMTGTILVNNPLDAYVPLKFIGNENSTYTNFKQFYCIYEQRFGHNQIVGYKNIDLLKDQIAQCSIRRPKDLLNLPPKVIVPEYIEMDQKQQKFYEDLQEGIVTEADRVDIKTTSLLGLITRLRQAASCPSVLTSNEEIESCKIERAIELVEDITSDGSKVVIFSTFKEPIYKLKEALSKFNPLIGTGDLDDKEVSDNIDKFQNNDSYKVFLATTAKCGTGVTLNSANYGIFIDSTWTDALETQVEDRLYRIGTNKTVFIYKLIAKGTIDERIQSILERKKAISDYIIDDKNTENEELKELLGIKDRL